MNKEEIEFIKNEQTEKVEITYKGKVYGEWNNDANCDFPEDLIIGRDLNNLVYIGVEIGKQMQLSTTPPPQTVSAREYYDKRLSEDSTIGTVQLMEEYRNQPIKFIPPHSAEQEADSMVNNYKEHDYEYAVLLSIANIDYAIYQLKAANVSTVWHEEVLTILKGM